MLYSMDPGLGSEAESSCSNSRMALSWCGGLDEGVFGTGQGRHGHVHGV